MQKFNKNDVDASAKLNKNFTDIDAKLNENVTNQTQTKESIVRLDKRIDKVTQDLENSKIKIKSQRINLGYGLEGTIVRNGRMVWLNAFGSQTSARHGNIQTLTEKIPQGFTPQTTIGVAGKVLIGSNIQNREIFYRFEANGSMSTYSISMDAAPLTIAFNVVWVTNDPMPNVV